VENDYDPNVPKWGYENYPIMFMYDDAQVNILKEGLPFQMDYKAKAFKEKEGI